MKELSELLRKIERHACTLSAWRRVYTFDELDGRTWSAYVAHVAQTAPLDGPDAGELADMIATAKAILERATA